MRVAAVGIGLPNFEKGVGYAVAVTIEHPATNCDLFASASLSEIRAVQRREANAEERSDGLRRCGVTGHLNAPWA
jgi:hypothetical protein